jgi:hypothetical protein
LFDERQKAENDPEGLDLLVNVLDGLRIHIKQTGYYHMGVTNGNYDRTLLSVDNVNGERA